MVTRSFLATAMLLTALGVSTNAQAGKVEKLNDTITLELVSKGSGAKQLLRYAPTAGTTEAFEVLNSIQMSMTMGDMAMPEQLIPTSSVTMNLAVDKVEANGDVHYNYSLTEASIVPTEGVDPAVAEAMLAALQNTVGLMGNGVTSSRGVSLSATVDLPDGIDPKVAEQVTESAKRGSGAVLPAKPVGVGAEWRVTEQVSQQGMEIEQVTTYTLQSMDGPRLTLDVAVTQSPNSSDFAAPGLPPGATAEFVSFETVGTGAMHSDLGHLSPATSHITIDLAMHVAIAAEGQQMDMKMNMGSTVNTKRK